MERLKNLSIALDPTRVIKSSEVGNRRLRQRLQNEHSALTLVQMYLPSRVPELFSFSLNGNVPQIVMERLGIAPDVPFDSIAELI